MVRRRKKHDDSNDERSAQNAISHNVLTSSNRISIIAVLIIFIGCLAWLARIYFPAHSDSTKSIDLVNDGNKLRLSGDDCPNGCRMNIMCSDGSYTPFVQGCHPQLNVLGSCARIVKSNFASPQEVSRLINIAEKGMKNRSKEGGPTILDINGGFLRDPDGVVKIYQDNNNLYSTDEYRFYGEIVERIRAFVQESFGLDFLYFTSPTFITRVVGNKDWKPRSLHDEYYHMHVDKDSTHHYDYSGLLYLSEYGVDFEGGLFRMEKPPMAIEPKPGLLLSFSAGKENRHQVMRVNSGTRYCLSFWFTCDASRRFSTFLDGKTHDRFVN